MEQEAPDQCSLCGSVMKGGVWTNGDGYGDAKHVGIQTPPMTGFCFTCCKDRSSEIPNFNARIDQAFIERGMCGFLQSWIGRCGNTRPCQKHGSETCRSCSAPATHDCEQTGQFVCGEPLCDDCEHTIFPEGHNGGVGFNAQPVPEGMKRHCKKSEQKFKPWYARDDSIDQHGEAGTT